MSDILNFAFALLVMLPLGGLCLWASYKLGCRLRVTDETSASLIGIVLAPLPFNLAFFILIHILRLRHDAEYAFSGVLLGGLMGMRAARLQNLKLIKSKPAPGDKLI